MAESGNPSPPSPPHQVLQWDAGRYLGFAGERLRPAVELLARIPDKKQPPGRIVDLGCGPGNATALLAARWPAANITGLDNAAAMIARARRDGPPGVDWQEADIPAWAEEREAPPPDIVYSNAALHWCPEHDRLFAQLMGRLAPGGILAVQMPRNFAAPSHTLLHDLAGEQPWKDKWKGNGPDSVRDPSPVATPETYYNRLAPYAGTLDVWETIYLHVLEGEDAVLRWTSGTALLPYLQALPPGDADAFRAAYGARLRDAYPRRDDGRTLFSFRRLFIVATAR